MTALLRPNPWFSSTMMKLKKRYVAGRGSLQRNRHCRLRVRDHRITGWCSWYNLYAAIDERSILDHLEATARFRDERQVPLEVFQIDDGFTPEMGDWLEVKPQFPRGMKPLIEDIEKAGLSRAFGLLPSWWAIAVAYMESIPTGWCNIPRADRSST